MAKESDGVIIGLNDWAIMGVSGSFKHNLCIARFLLADGKIILYPKKIKKYIYIYLIYHKGNSIRLACTRERSGVVSNKWK